MKKGTDFLLLFLITFLSINLVFQSCQKEPNLTAQSSSSDSNSSVNDRGGDSLDYYKTMVAKCVARGLGDSNFKTFFNRVSVRGEGGQSGFSLWHYRDSLVTTSQTLASFLSVQAGYLGYSYNAQFFRGHLVRYIPNLAIGISIWGTSSVSTYVFASTTKVAVISSEYYSDTTNGGNAVMYSQTQVSSTANVDNANYDFAYVEENPYYELFKVSNNKSLTGDKTVPELYGLPSNTAFDSDFSTDVGGTTYKYRMPGTETIAGTNCYLVDKSKVMNFYAGGSGGSTGDPGNPGDNGAGNSNGTPCTGDCERDNLNGYERVRFLQMVHGSSMKKQFGCKKTKDYCFFAITQYRFVRDATSSAAVADQTTKVVGLWEKGLRNGLWVWWNDIDNKYVIWDFCDGSLGNQMLYGIIGKNPLNGTETTTTFGFESTVKFKVGAIEVTVPLGPNFSFSKKKTNKDFDFGQTENVYYCDPGSVGGYGQIYSTGSVRIRVLEME